MSDENLHDTDPLDQVPTADAYIVPPVQSFAWTEEMLARLLGRSVIMRLLENEYREDWQLRRIVSEARGAFTHGRTALQQQGRW